MNERLRVEYLQGSVTICREMNQIELTALLLDEDIFLLSVNPQKSGSYEKKEIQEVIPTQELF